MTENFLKLLNKIDIQGQEAQRIPNELDPKKTIPRHIKLKCQRLKIERILKAARKKRRVTYKGVRIRLSANF